MCSFKSDYDRVIMYVIYIRMTVAVCERKDNYYDA